MQPAEAAAGRTDSIEPTGGRSPIVYLRSSTPGRPVTGSADRSACGTSLSSPTYSVPISSEVVSNTGHGKSLEQGNGAEGLATGVVEGLWLGQPDHRDPQPPDRK